MKSITFALITTLTFLTFLFIFTNAQADDEPTVAFEIALFPTITNDLDPRTYYQGTVTINGCSQKCVSAKWDLTIESADHTGTIITEHIDNTKGSLTSWSFYLNSESLCTNTASPLSPSVIQFCQSQQIDDKSEFSGQFRWHKGKKETKAINSVKFNLIVSIDYDHDDDRTTPPEIITLPSTLERHMVYVENAGIVDYIGANKGINFHYTFATSFRTLGPSNHFALRPFGALSHDFFQDLSCTVNGIHLSAPYKTTNPSHPMFASYLFTLQPHQNDPWVPYTYFHTDVSEHNEYTPTSQQQQQLDQYKDQPQKKSKRTRSLLAADDQADEEYYFSFDKDTYMTLQCEFIHSSRFYADELPFGLALSIAELPTEKSISAEDLESINQLLTQSPTWFLPRFSVYNQLEFTKRSVLSGAFFSGIYPQKSGKSTSYYGALAVDIDIIPLATFECRNPTGQQQSGIAELILAISESDWDVDSIRYMVVGYDSTTSAPNFTLGGILDESDADLDDELLTYKSIDLCPLFNEKELSTARNVRLTFQISGRYTGSTQPFDYEAEYPTPAGLSPCPFNAIFTLKQSAIDAEKRVLTSYQPLSVSWATNYQLLSSPSQPYPMLSVNFERKTESNYEYFPFELELEAMAIDANVVLFWFPSGHWGFFLESAQCSIYETNGNKSWDTHHEIQVQPFVIDYTTKNSALAFHHPTAFQKDKRYVFKCKEAAVRHSSEWTNSHTRDSALGIFILPATDHLQTFLTTQHTTEPDTHHTLQQRLQKALSIHIHGYLPHGLPTTLIYDLQTRDVTNVPHYSQVPISFPQAPKSRVALIVGLVILGVVMLAAIIGFFCWRRRQANLRKAAFMAYVDVYNDSVQEYM